MTERGIAADSLRNRVPTIRGSVDSTLSPVLEVDVNEVHVSEHPGQLAGELFGAVTHEGPIGPVEVRERLDSAESFDDALRLIAQTVGEFILFVERADGVSIVTSPSSAGLFIRPDFPVSFSNDETEMYELSDLDALDSLAVVDTVAAHHSVRPPESTIFKDVERAVGGEHVFIDADGGLDRSNYFRWNARGRTANETFTYNEFVGLTEDIISLIANGTEDEERYLSFSGGIDSAFYLCILQSTGTEATCVHWPISKYERDLATKVANIVGVNLEFTEVNSPDSLEDYVDQARPLYESGLAMQSHWNSSVLDFKAYFDSRNEDLPLFLSGQNMEDNYMVQMMEKKYLQFFYSEPFYALLSNGAMGAVLDRMGYGVENYIESQALADGDHYTPYTENSVVPPGSLRERHTEFKRDAYLAPLLKGFDGEQQRLDSSTLSRSDLQYLVNWSRMLKYSQNAPLTALNHGRYGNYHSMMPAQQGPFLARCLSMDIGFRDLLTRRRYMHQYFEEQTGHEYQSIWKDALDKDVVHYAKKFARPYTPDAVRRAYQYVSPGSEYHEHLESNIGTSLDAFNKLVTLDDSVVLSAVDSEVESYLSNLFAPVATGSTSNLKKSELKRIERFVNLECMLNASHG